MIQEGQIVLFQFPQTNLTNGKLRPALVVRRLPGDYKDWLVCMVSSQLKQVIKDFDEVIRQDDDDFNTSGLKSESVIRIFRLAVVDQSIFIGRIGEISLARLTKIQTTLSYWLMNKLN